MWVMSATFRLPDNHCAAGCVGFGSGLKGTEELAPTEIRFVALYTY